VIRPTSTSTIRLVWAGTYEEAGDECVYVVRDGEVVLYVGRTRETMGNRLRGHCNHRSALGTLIREHRPESGGWRVDMFTLCDCEPLIRRWFPHRETLDIEHAERALIRELRPCLNAIDNPGQARVPERYSEQSMTDAPADHLGLSVEGT